jgi:hypothetical protein
MGHRIGRYRRYLCGDLIPSFVHGAVRLGPWCHCCSALHEQASHPPPTKIDRQNPAHRARTNDDHFILPNVNIRHIDCFTNQPDWTLGTIWLTEK